MWFDPGYGYHTDHTTGIAVNNEPESIYAVMSGTRKQLGHGCCFDYGNSENSITSKNKSQGSGAMEAIYFGQVNHLSLLSRSLSLSSSSHSNNNSNTKTSKNLLHPSIALHMLTCALMR